MATKPQQTATQQRVPLNLNIEQVTNHLVRAQPSFSQVMAAPRDIPPLVWESELEFARNIVMKDSTERLRKVLPETLTSCMRDLANVGLTLNPIKKFCTIIARWNDTEKLLEAHILFMYRGLAYLATQAGVSDIQSDVVYTADTFKVERRSDGDFFTHGLNVLAARGGDENPFLGAYCAARMPKTQQRKIEWVPREDIFKMRDKSDSYTDSQGKIRPTSPWVVWFDEMAKKGALKRAVKRWEETIDAGSTWQRLHRAIQLDHEADGRTTIEGTASEVPVVTKLSIEQITTIENKARELGHGDVGKYMRKVCGAYGTEVLADVPAKHFQEILERIATSKSEMDKRRAKDPKDTTPKQATKPAPKEGAK